MHKGPIPLSIRAEQKRATLVVHWNDDHVSEYPYWLIRAACPCAECRGGHDQMSDQPPQDIFNLIPEDNSRTRIESLQHVGSYGLMFLWEDGHSAGIYSFHYLRLLCPCSECREG